MTSVSWIVVATAEQGVLQGGWEFIWAAYGATWLFMGGYALTLVTRNHHAISPATPGPEKS